MADLRKAIALPGTPARNTPDKFVKALGKA
jgi:hypothetical protein